MNAFNRVLATLVLLVLIPLVTVALIAPREAIELLQNGLDELYTLIDARPSGIQVFLRVLAAVAVNAFLVFILYLEFRRPKATSVRVRRASGSEAQIAIDSISDRLVYHLDRLPGVLDVAPTVSPHRRGVKVLLDIEMAADEDVPACIDEVTAITRRVVEQDMGLKLSGKPKLNLRAIAYPGALPGAGDSRLWHDPGDRVAELGESTSIEEVVIEEGLDLESEIEDTQPDESEPGIDPA